MKTYQIFLTRIFEVKVRAENRDHAEELFDRFADWDEFLKVHNLDVELIGDDEFILSEENAD
jgi:hypothetical protein